MIFITVIVILIFSLLSLITSQMKASTSLKRFNQEDLNEDEKKMRYSKTTNYSTSSAKKLLKDFMQIKSFIPDNDSPSFKHQFDSVLHDFLLSVRKEDGTNYSIGGFTNLYFALCRSVMEDYSMDIIHDSLFMKTKNARKTKQAILKKEGKGHVVHTETISQEDLEKISKLDESSPQQLQLKTWFLLHFHLALSGRENDHNLKKTDIVITVENGHKCLEIRDMLTKNHRGNEQEKSIGAKLYATSTDNCPIRCIENYLSKLNPMNEYLWQRPKSKLSSETQIWYENRKCGINQVGQFMPKISKVAALSKEYKNHSPRATCITILGNGYQDSDVATHSGHKTISAMSIYKRTSDTTKKNMSKTLSNTLSHLISPDDIGLVVPDTAQLEQSDCHNQCCISHGISTATDTNPVAINDVSNSVNAWEMQINDFFNEYKDDGNITQNLPECPPVKPSFTNCSFSNCTFNFK
jgi:hypothetical protein